MKKIIVVGLLLLSIGASAQKIGESKVPGEVKAAFALRFPGSGQVKWEMEKGNYEAGFTQKGEKTSALFDKGGNLLETENAIKISDLPKGIAAYIAKNYSGAKIKEAARLKMANGDTNYEAEVKGSDLIFDADGKFIKSVKD